MGWVDLVITDKHDGIYAWANGLDNYNIVCGRVAAVGKLRISALSESSLGAKDSEFSNRPYRKHII